MRELASHLVNPGVEHLKAAERVVQYLHHTRKLCLEYKHVENATGMETSFYGTADAAHNVTWNAKGITGWAYHLNGGAICWHCRAQKTSALSSTEAELVAVDGAIRELRYLHKVLGELGQQTTLKPAPVGQDNMSTLTLCRGTHFNPSTHHIALRYHHAGDMQRLGVVKLQYLKTPSIPADALTKPLPVAAFRQHRAVLLGHESLRWEALKQVS